MYESSHVRSPRSHPIARREVSRIARWAAAGLIATASLPFIAYGSPGHGGPDGTTTATGPTADIITHRPTG